MATRMRINTFTKNDDGTIELVQKELTRKSILEFLNNSNPICPDDLKDSFGSWIKFDFKVNDDGKFEYLYARCTVPLTETRRALITKVLECNPSATEVLNLKELRNYTHRKDFVKRVQDILTDIVTPSERMRRLSRGA